MARKKLTWWARLTNNVLSRWEVYLFGIAAVLAGVAVFVIGVHYGAPAK
jgi:hypothetical protein